jgi:hypothetical protein
MIAIKVRVNDSLRTQNIFLLELEVHYILMHSLHREGNHEQSLAYSERVLAATEQR